MGKRSFFFVILLVAVVGSLFPVEDYRTRIAVAPMRNNTGDPQYNAVCSTVTDTVSLVIRFLQNYLVIDQEDNPQLASLDIGSEQAIGGFCDANKYDEILYGSADLREGGGFVFRLQVFNNADKATKTREEVVAESMLDVFDAADQITARIISHISNVHIGFGSIQLNLEGPESEYTVYLDGHKVRNPRQLFKKVLNGSYALAIHQDRILGDTIIFEKQIDVFEEQPTVVSFSIPPASAEEKQFIEEKKREVLANADDPTKISDLVKSIVSFQEKTLKVDYDPGLEAYINNTLSEFGSKAGSILMERVKEADTSYYAKRPDFAQALDSYESISKIVNDTFDFKIAQPPTDEPLVEPFAVRTAPNGYFYVLDGSSVNRLHAFNEAGTHVAARKLSNDGQIDHFSIAVDADSRLYCLDRTTGSLSIYSPQLEPLATFPVPGYRRAEQGANAVAVSADQEVFVVGAGGVIAFPYDPDVPADIERDGFIEEAIAAGLAGYPDFQLTDAFVDPQNHLNLFSWSTKELLVFGARGKLIKRVPIDGAESFSGVTVDKLGYIYVTIPSQHKVVKYRPDGALVTTFGQYGVAPGDFAQPHGIDVTDSYDLVVADYFNNRVQVVHPVSPPILLPEVSRYGILVSNRVDAAERAESVVKNTNDRVRPVRSLGRMGGSLLSFGGAFGLALATDYFARQTVVAYDSYQAATNPATVDSLHTKVSLNWALSQTSLLGTYAALGTGVALLTSALTGALDAPAVRRNTIQGLQNLSLDYSYEIDPKAYRGLRRAQNIGIWTGIAPPILGLAAAIGGPMVFPSLDSATISYLTMGSVALPPIFSHLYARRFSLGLLVSGLLADALAVSSYWVSGGSPAADTQTRYADPQTTLPGLLSQTVGPNFATYLAVAALSVRLAAGIYDASQGWLAALSYNEFKAQKQVRPILQAMVVPYTDGRAIGLLCQLRM